MLISLIAALSNNHAIGFQNDLPWHLRADLNRFKTLTLGKPVVMGRKTYESIGKPLPDRRNIVISSQSMLQNDHHYTADCEVYASLQEALSVVENHDETMIIGGGQLFSTALPEADRLYLTLIHGKFEGDVFFPDWNRYKWRETKRESHQADQKNKYAYDFVDLERAW